MESFSMNTSGDYKHQIGNLNRNFATNRTLYSYPSDDLLLATVLSGGYFTGAGLLSVPPASLNHSFPPAVLGFRPPQNLQRHRQQPPLLPLPVSVPKNHQNMNIYRSNSSSNNNIRLSPPRVNKNVKNRVRDHSVTPKKSKNQKKNSKREDVDLAINTTESSVSEIIGPDPKDLPKNVVSRVFSSSVNKLCDVSADVDEFSGSVVFSPSPPPSSLPLPTFSLRPKLGCKAQAAAVGFGVDAGATDSLRRLLRL
ncbi:hypothetical protein HanOQP8_Chr13g0465381 [Helianthus annuus]|nr:hypothetical protein HanOQP8_Chr13g0465381 [Helianthus annuus]